MNRYHVVLTGSSNEFPNGASFVLHSKTLKSAKEEARKFEADWKLTLASVKLIRPKKS